MVSTNQAAPSPVARSSAAQNTPLKRPTSPVSCLVVLAGKMLGQEAAEGVFGPSYNVVIAETSVIQAVVGLVPVIGEIALGFLGDAKLNDLESALTLVAKNKSARDFDKAFEHQLEAAELHHVDSMLEVGKTYLAKKDTTLARYWLDKAATTYHKPFAYLHLYMMYKDSEPEYAEALLAKSKALGHLEFFLEQQDGDTFKEQFETALFAAALGDIDSMIIVGKTFYEVSNDKTSALKWLEKAASIDSPEAYYEIFKLLEKSDVDKAFYALNWAAEAGHQQAIRQLVDIYENTGFGAVRPNGKLANVWKQKLNDTESKKYSAISIYGGLYIMPMYDTDTKSFVSSKDT